MTLPLDPKKRHLIITATLLALFLGALDALVMSAAMPTIVSDLGGMTFYSWVYSAYFLARAISLPIFGKLADLYHTKTVFLSTISIFIGASVLAGFSTSMEFLVFARVIQGIGAGGNFALVYIVLADISPVEKRGKTLGMASSIWGIASVLGPTLGGFIVTYFSWRWIFFINLPLGLFSLLGLYWFLIDTRQKKAHVDLDFSGVFMLSVFILSFLSIFLVGGRNYPWLSWQMAGLLAVSVLSGIGFYRVEQRAKEPILSLQFFGIRGFATGNVSVFFSSFAIFSLFAYAPVFIQGALVQSPMAVGTAMLSLSLGWSVGSMGLGQIVHWLGEKIAAVAGGGFLTTGCALILFFNTQTTMATCFWVFFLVGLGMGFVTLSTLLIVQVSLDVEDLGVATASHQFSRTLGGTVGIGICGGLFTTRLSKLLEQTPMQGASNIAGENPLSGKLELILQPEFLAALPEASRNLLRDAVTDSVSIAFLIVAASAVLCLLWCLMLPRLKPGT